MGINGIVKTEYLVNMADEKKNFQVEKIIALLPKKLSV